MPADAMRAVLSGAAPWCVVEGDSASVLSSLPDGCCDAVVSDPPAGVAFMGFLGVEMSAEYASIARARLAHAQGCTEATNAA